jgi:hypothetical protein
VADHFYGLRFGDNLGDIVYGTSSNSDGAPASTFELRIHDGAGITKAEALRLIEVIKSYIRMSGELGTSSTVEPPAG